MLPILEGVIEASICFYLELYEVVHIDVCKESLWGDVYN